MRIEKFQYQNKALEWQLEEVSFSDLTLLVGISGVGKTLILQALLNMKEIANGESRNGIKWKMVFSTNEGHRYIWCGEFENCKQSLSNKIDFSFDDDATLREKPKILSETLHRNDQEIVSRTQEKILLNGTETPKLSPTSSIIDLLCQEDSIGPASRAFHRIVHSDQSIPERSNRIPIIDNFEELAGKYTTLQKIQESELATPLKLAIVCKTQPEAFGKIQDRFLEIFPQVTKIKIEPKKEQGTPYFFYQTPIIQIREEGVSDWIDQSKISSGMLRTLFHIAEMYLLPEGTVTLIDEFENSLGVNCIDVLTEDLLQPHRDLQFILTSHHPYIINNIGPKYWKVVRRTGGVVTTHDASSLKLDGSSHEAFIQLINSDEFREGVKIG